MATTSEIMIRVIPDPEVRGNLTGTRANSERFAERVAELGESIGRIATDLHSRLDGTLAKPSAGSDWELGEVTMTFSVELEAGGGVVFATARSSAGLEVQLTWSRSEPTQ